MVRLPGKGEEGGGWRWGGGEGGRGGELALKSRFDFKSLFRPLFDNYFRNCADVPLSNILALDN